MDAIDELMQKKGISSAATADIDALMKSKGIAGNSGGEGLSFLNKNYPNNFLTQIADKLGGLVSGKSPEDVKKAWKKPSEAISDIAKVIPFIATGGEDLPAQMAINAGVNAGSGVVSGLAEGKGVKNSLLRGGQEGVTAAGMTGLFGKLGEGLSILGKKAAPKISSAMANTFGKAANIPAEYYENAAQSALAGKAGNIFNKSKEEDALLLNELAEKAKEGTQFLKTKAGESVAGEKAALREAGKAAPKLDSKPIVENIDEILNKAKTSTGQTTFSNQELRKIEDVKSYLKSGLRKKIAIDDANAFKNDLNEAINQSERLRGKMDKGDFVLQNVAAQIDDQLGKKAPELYSANKEYAGALENNSLAREKMSDIETKGKNLASMVRNNTPMGQNLQEINNVLPPENQFAEPLRDAITRREFRNVLPLGGEDKITPQSLMRSALPRAAIYGGLGLFHHPLVAGGLALASSPIVNKGILKGISAGVNFAPKLGAAASRLAVPIAANASGQLTPESYDEILRARGIR